MTSLFVLLWIVIGLCVTYVGREYVYVVPPGVFCTLLSTAFWPATLLTILAVLTVVWGRALLQRRG